MTNSTSCSYEMKRPLKKRGASYLSAAAIDSSSSEMPRSADFAKMDEDVSREDRRLALLSAASALASLPLSAGPSPATATRLKETATTTVQETMKSAIAMIDARGAVPVPSSPTRKTPKTFPEILMDVLSAPESRGLIEWLPGGASFVVLEPFDLASDVLPRYFKRSQCQYESFVRKLNRWGFRRVGGAKHSNRDSGAYYHELFVRDRPELCKRMRCRIRSNGASSGGGEGGAEVQERPSAFKSQLSQLATSRANAAAAKRALQRQCVLPMSVESASADSLCDMLTAFPATTGLDGSVNALKMSNASLPNLALVHALTKKHLDSYGSSDGLTDFSSAVRQQSKDPLDPSTDPATLSSLLARRNAAALTELLAARRRAAAVSALAASPPTMPASPEPTTTTTPSDDKVTASFLRHQKLLRMTQRSRALLRQSGLLTGPTSM